MSIFGHNISLRAVIAAMALLFAVMAFVILAGDRPAQAHAGSVAIAECQIAACHPADHGRGDAGQGAHEHSHCSPGGCGHAFMTAPEGKTSFSSPDQYSESHAPVELTGMSAPPPQPPPKFVAL